MFKLHRLVSLVFIYGLLCTLSVDGRSVASSNGVEKLRTIHTAITDNGLVTETCDITLTPITDGNDDPAVEEVSRCSVVFVESGGPNPAGDPGIPGGSSGGLPSSATSQPTTTARGFSTEPIVAGTTTVQTELPATTSTAVGTTGATIAASIPTTRGMVTLGNPLPTDMPIISDSTAASSTATLESFPPTASSSTLTTSTLLSSIVLVSPSIPLTSVQITSQATLSTSTTLLPPSTAEASSDPLPTISPGPVISSEIQPKPTTPISSVPDSTTSALASNTSPTSTFQLPGKKLSVLPIGLGVFAGISAIALIVVGLVTWERTRYRKRFRQRRFAESGLEMGYSSFSSNQRTA